MTHDRDQWLAGKDMSTGQATQGRHEVIDATWDRDRHCKASGAECVGVRGEQEYVNGHTLNIATAPRPA